MTKLAAATCTILLVLFGSRGAHAQDAGAPEEQKIEYLLGAVESMTDAQFIRNGTAYDGKRAAEHLRMKRKRAGDRVKTAEDFIRYCASASSRSGKPYHIKLRDGRVVTAADFLHGKLREFRAPGRKDNN